MLVIGSGFGFSVVCLALGLKDNGTGRLSFVDPSYSVLTDGVFKTVGGTAQWSDPQKVRSQFARYGVEDIVTHHRMRSDEFFAASRADEIDVAFIDGSHAYADVKHDFLAALRRARRNSYLLLHDTNIYIRELFELVDFPFSSGVALVRVLRDDAWKSF